MIAEGRQLVIDEDIQGMDDAAIAGLLTLGHFMLREPERLERAQVELLGQRMEMLRAERERRASE